MAAARRLGRVAAALRARPAAAAAPDPPDLVPEPPLDGAERERFLAARQQPLDMPPPPPAVGDMAAQLVADGFLHLPGCLSSERNAELLRLTRWCMANPGGTAAGREPLRGGGPHEAMAGLPPGSDPPPTPPSGGGCIQWHVNNAWNRNPEHLQYLTVSPTVDIAEAVLGADCRVLATTNWVTGPGRPDGGLHNDYLPFSVPAQLLESGRVRMPVFIITAHCAHPSP